MLIEKIKARINKKGNDRKALLSKTTKELGVSVRTFDVLRRAGIDTVGDLIGLRWEDLAGVRRSNRVMCLEIVGLLDGVGLKLREDD